MLKSLCASFVLVLAVGCLPDPFDAVDPGSSDNKAEPIDTNDDPFTETDDGFMDDNEVSNAYAEFTVDAPAGEETKPADAQASSDENEGGSDSGSTSSVSTSSFGNTFSYFCEDSGLRDKPIGYIRARLESFDLSATAEDHPNSVLSETTGILCSGKISVDFILDPGTKYVLNLEQYDLDMKSIRTVKDLEFSTSSTSKSIPLKLDWK